MASEKTRIHSWGNCGYTKGEEEGMTEGSGGMTRQDVRVHLGAILHLCSQQPMMVKSWLLNP